MIVVASNGYPDADSALEWAAHEARRRGTSLRIVDAVPGLVIESAYAVLAEAEATARSYGAIDIETAVEIGNPAGVLVRASEGAELLVVGNRGRGEFRAALLGSVSVAVAAHAKCPVVVVRQGVTGELDAQHGVLVGSDGSQQSTHAVEFAAGLAARAAVRLTVIGAWSLPSDTGLGTEYWGFGDLDAHLDAVRDGTQRAVDAVAARLRPRYPDLDIATLVVQGEPSAVLSDASGDAGLVVVGTRGHGGFAGLLLGSISHQVIHDAHCPVAVVR